MVAIAVIASLLLGFVGANPANAASTFSKAPTPVISGTAAVGSTLTANTGAWSPTPDSFAYQWKRNGTSISGATAKTYKTVAADGGTAITVTVVASKSGYTPTPKTSAAKNIPVLQFTTAPTPTISGTASVGSTLTANTGTWSPAPDSFTYRWLRGGVAITGATSKTYKTVQADGGADISVTVTASKVGYAPTARTSASRTVPAATFTTSPTPTISGVAKVGSTLTTTTGTWSPTPDAFAYQWLRNSVAIDGANASTYKVVAGDGGAILTVKVTASKTGYKTTSKVSGGTAVPAANFAAAPNPTITGTVASGSVLTATPGSWSPTPDSFAYQWLRDGVRVGSGSTYTVQDADEGSSLSVTVTAIKAGYAATSRISAPTLLDIPDVIRAASLTADTDWLAPTVRLVIAGSGVYVPPGVTLRVGPGVTVKVGDAAISVDGVLRAKGSSTAPVTITSLTDDSVLGDSNGDGAATAPQAGSWRGIGVGDRGSLDLYRANVLYGGGVNAPGFTNDWDGSIEEDYFPLFVQVLSSTIHGDVSVYEHGGTDPVNVSSNTITGNVLFDNGVSRFRGNRVGGNITYWGGWYPGSSHAANVFYGDAPKLSICGSIGTDWTLPTDGLTVVIFNEYYCSTGLTIPAGVTLTVPGGVTLRALEGIESGAGYPSLRVEGVLKSTATASNPSVMTTTTDKCDDPDPDRRDWQLWGGVRNAGGSIDLTNIDVRCASDRRGPDWW